MQRQKWRDEQQREPNGDGTLVLKGDFRRSKDFLELTFSIVTFSIAYLVGCVSIPTACDLYWFCISR